MEFELNDDQVKELELKEEQVAKIKEIGTNYAAELKKSYDDLANKNAQGILDGAGSSIEKSTGVKRDQGEKMADYILRANSTYHSTLKSELEAAKADYLEKQKSIQGNEGLSKELQELKEKFEDAQKKLANFDDLSEKATKYETLTTEYESMKHQVAFSNVKPAFPDSVNSYEAKAKWDEFVSRVNKEYTIELVEGEAIAISRENKHKQVKLSVLVEKDGVISELTKGRIQNGNGANPIDVVKIEGIPFDVPKDYDTAKINKLIQDYLIKEGVAKTSPQWPSKFGELFKKIKSQQNG